MEKLERLLGTVFLDPPPSRRTKMIYQVEYVNDINGNTHKYRYENRNTALAYAARMSKKYGIEVVYVVGFKGYDAVGQIVYINGRKDRAEGEKI